MTKIQEIPGSNNALLRKTYYYPEYYDLGGFLTKVGQGYGLGSAGTGTAGEVISATGNVVGGAVGGAISGGMTSGAGNMINGLSGIASAIPGPWGAIIGGGLKVVGGLVNRFAGSKINEQAVADIKGQNNLQNNFTVDQSSNDALLQSSGKLNLLGNINSSEVGKDGIFTNKVKKLTKQLNSQREGSNAMAINTMIQGSDNVDDFNDATIAANYGAYGGMMPSIQTGLGYNYNPAVKYAIGGPLIAEGGIFDNNIKYINEGSTHERNPNGGIPISMNPNGQPNMVEEGETVWNNFVFSNRLRPSEKALVKNNLSKKLHGKTYAEISRDLTEEFKETPNDSILKDTTNKLLDTLSQMQESQKGIEEASNQALNEADPQEEVNTEQGNSQGMPQDNPNDQMMQQEDEGNPQGDPNQTTFAKGGQMNTAKSSIAFFMNKGLTQVAATGLVGNLMRESNLNPSAVNSTSKAYGVAQWLGKRKQDLFKKYGRNPNLQDQLNFVWDELNSTHKTGLKALQRSRTISEAATNGFGYYEFSGGPRSATEAMNKTGQAGNEALLKGINNARKLAGIGQITMKDMDPALLSAAGTSTKSTKPKDMTGLESVNNLYNDFTPKPLNFNTPNNSQNDLLTQLQGVELPSEQSLQQNPYNININTSNIDNKYNALAQAVGIQDYGQLPYALGGFMFGDRGTLRNTSNINKNYDMYQNIRMHNLNAIHFAPGGQLFDTHALNFGFDSSNLNTKLGIKIPKSNQFNTHDLNFGFDSSNLNTKLGIKIPKSNQYSTPNDRTEDNTSDLSTYLRYAPAVGAGIGMTTDLLGLTNKPDYSMANKFEALANKGDYIPVSPTPIGNYMKYNPMDYNYGLNLLHSQEGSTINAIRDNANGNQGIANAALLAADYNQGNQEGALFRQGLEYNNALEKQVAEFNRGTDQYNSQNDLQAQMANQQALASLRQYQLQGLGQAAALRDSLDARTSAARSTNLTNFFNSLGAIGQDNLNFNRANSLFNYINNRDGSIDYNNPNIPKNKDGSINWNLPLLPVPYNTKFPVVKPTKKSTTKNNNSKKR